MTVTSMSSSSPGPTAAGATSKPTNDNNYHNSAITSSSPKQLPRWHYEGRHPQELPQIMSRIFPALDGPNAINLGTYRREHVSNVDSIIVTDATTATDTVAMDVPLSTTTTTTTNQTNLGRAYFDLGLRLMFSYQHERAVHSFLACLAHAPHCALAHGLIALCHSPNYNFKGEAYYESTHHPDEGKHYINSSNGSSSSSSTTDTMMMDALSCIFPSQQVADRHSKLAMEKVEELRKRNRKQNNTAGGGTSSNGKRGGGKSKGGGGSRHKASDKSKKHDTESSPTTTTPPPTISVISDVETQLLSAIRILCCQPGIDPGLSDETVGRPYADALRKIHTKYPQDAEVCYLFGEALMVLNAWKLYEYPTGRPLSPDVVETQSVLESALQLHPQHPGLCHMYVHLMEMSSHPGRALAYCQALRSDFPNAGHLIHMPSHIDVLVGDYVSCVKSNCDAVLADERAMTICPETAGRTSFYFGYIVHNYHMAVYGAILAGMEQKAMELAQRLNHHLNEAMFAENPDLVDYLESYSALEIHVMVRFGRWHEILQVTPPHDSKLMLFRAATLKFARALAFTMTQEFLEAKREADRFDALRQHAEAKYRILHNNSVYDLLAVDAPMLRGEMAYRQGKYEEAFKLLRKAVQLQDALNYDEPWGKMQPIRHALGGLLLEQGQYEEAEQVFRTDLLLHPKNPWALVGLIRCLREKLKGPETTDSSSSSSSSCCCSDVSKNQQGGGDGVSAAVRNRSSDTTTTTTTTCHRNTAATSEAILEELQELCMDFDTQQKSEWVDFKVKVACLCCRQDPPP